MLTWKELSAARPDLADAGRKLVYQHDVGLGHLATVRRDGGPRVHCMCPLLTDEGLYAFIVPGPKFNDLRRDPRYALDTESVPPPNYDDGFYITGVVREPTDAALREQLKAQMLAERTLTVPWPGFDDQLFIEFLIETCLLTTTVANDTFPAGHTIWHANAK